MAKRKMTKNKQWPKAKWQEQAMAKRKMTRTSNGREITTQTQTNGWVTRRFLKPVCISGAMGW